MASMFLVSACALVYELLISALSSYFLGASVLHFSLTIGFFLFFMGVGSFSSRLINDHLLEWYVVVEILIGLVGGLSGVVLYMAYSITEYYYLVAIVLIALISGLAGLEIPLLTRLLERTRGLKHSLADVLSFDYMGALIASLLFPLILVPYLGLQRTAFAMGLINALVALSLVYEFRARLHGRRTLIGAATGVVVVLVVGFAMSFRITGFFEQYLYQDEIVSAQQSPYQRIVLTQSGKDLRLFLNGSLQFSSVDEYRYHEALVHIPATRAGRLDHVLVLGGGDGLAVRELLKYSDVQTITLVDLDPAMTELGQTHAHLLSLSGGALHDPRVRIVNQDAFKFLEQSDEFYNLIIIDLPDPSLLELGKLYSVEFYHLVARHMAADGAMVTQASSPYFARKVFWSTHATAGEVFGEVVAYNAYVPSFGLWGFVMAAPHRLDVRRDVPEGLRFLDSSGLDGLADFPADIGPLPVEPNRLQNQIIVRYYEESWNDF